MLEAMRVGLHDPSHMSSAISFPFLSSPSTGQLNLKGHKLSQSVDNLKTKMYPQQPEKSHKPVSTEQNRV